MELKECQSSMEQGQRIDLLVFSLSSMDLCIQLQSEESQLHISILLVIACKKLLVM